VWLGIGTHHSGLLYGLVPAAAAFGGVALFLLLPRVSLARLPGRHALESMAGWVSDTERVAFQPDWRLLGALGYLLFDIAVLWACLRAVGTHAPLLALVVGYQIGYLANVVPIPGSLGVLDGGLVGALVLYGVPAAPAAAAVVLYHAIALWLPTIGGTVGFVQLRSALAKRSARAGAPATEVPAINGTVPRGATTGRRPIRHAPAEAAAQATAD